MSGSHEKLLSDGACAPADDYRASQKETAPFRNSVTRHKVVVLPPISADAVRPIRISMDGKLSFSHPSNDVSISSMLQSMILRSPHGSQASGSQIDSRRSSVDANAISGLIIKESRRTSSIFGDDEEALHPTLLAMSNSAADLDTLTTLQGILDAELMGDTERQVRRMIVIVLPQF